MKVQESNLFNDLLNNKESNIHIIREVNSKES